MTRPKHFRTDYSAGPVITTGQTLNKIGDTLNGLIPSLGGLDQRIPGVGPNQPIGTPPFIFGVAEITSASDDGIISGGEQQAPKSSKGKYLAEFRWLNPRTFQWERNPTVELRIDTRCYKGEIPKLKVGDTVPAWYDQHSMWCLPVVAPPDYLSESYYIKGDSNSVAVKRHIDRERWMNAAVVWLEHAAGGDPGTWYRSLPELILRPEHRNYGASGATSIAIGVAHQDTLRLMCGTHIGTRVKLNVTDWSVAVRWLGPIAATGSNPGTEAEQASDPFASSVGVVMRDVGPEQYEYTPPSEPAEDLPDIGDFNANPLPLTWVADSVSRYKHYPRLTFEGQNLRVDMVEGHEDKFYMGVVTITARAEQTSLHAFCKIKRSSGDGTTDGGGAEGKLSEGDSNGLHIAELVEDQLGTVGSSANVQTSQRVWLAFIDRFGFADAEFFIPLAEQDRIYGPCAFAGMFDGFPLYVTTIGTEQYVGKSLQKLNKGESGDFAIYSHFNGSLQSTGISINATAKFNAYTANKFAIVERVHGGQWYANQIECGT